MQVNGLLLKNIVFDWGGVFTRGNNIKILGEFLHKKTGVSSEWVMAVFRELQRPYEFGLISADAFWGRFQEAVNDIVDSHTAQNAFVTGPAIDWGMIDMLGKLKSTVRAVLLTNGFQDCMQYYRSVCGIHCLFSTIYCSCETGVRKPDKRAYLNVIEGEGIRPEETVFIDDKPKNVQKAADMGFHAYQFRSTSSLREYLYLSGMLVTNAVTG